MNKNIIPQKSLNRRLDKTLLPTPTDYYGKEFGKLPKTNATGWAVVKCPFHDDNRPSLNINLRFGGFKCWSCGAHGGDIIAFEMQKTGKTFKETVTNFNAWSIKNG